jgi:hypothetical protein
VRVKLSQGAKGNGYRCGPKPAWFRQKKGEIMGTLELIILIVVLLALFGGGGGYYWSRRR